MSMHSSLERVRLFDGGGDSPPVVFLHGLGGTHRYWNCGAVPAAFAGHRTCLVDLLGFGDAPRPWARYTVQRHLDALEPALRDLGHVTLVGHSLGAALALAYAARHPQAIRGLALLSLPYYGGMVAASRWFRRQPGGWVYTNMAATGLACVLTRRVAGRLLPILLRDIPREVAEDLVKHNAASSTSSLWEVLYKHDLRTDADALPASLPVLCIHGDCDTTAPLDGARSLAAGRAAWNMTELKGVDHHPWLRAAPLCAELIRRRLLDGPGIDPGRPD